MPLQRTSREPSPKVSTPAYLNIGSPAAISPGREVAPPSPNMQLVYERARRDRAMLLLQGETRGVRLQDRYKQLFDSMCDEDCRYMTAYIANDR